MDKVKKFQKELNALVGREEPLANYKILPDLVYNQEIVASNLNLSTKECEKHPFCSRRMLINEDFPRKNIVYSIGAKVYTSW
jgi:hypothetical protein